MHCIRTAVWLFYMVTTVVKDVVSRLKLFLWRFD